MNAQLTSESEKRNQRGWCKTQVAQVDAVGNRRRALAVAFSELTLERPGRRFLQMRFSWS